MPHQITKKNKITKFLISFLALFFGIVFFITHNKEQFIGLEHFDEGITLFSAVNLLNGKLPYRDYNILYPPGFTIFVASVFRLFGATLFNARLATLILHSLTVSLAFILSSLTGSVIFGVITALMIIIFHTDIQRGSMPLIIIGFILLYLFFKSQKNKYLFSAGLALGLSSFFRLDFSIYSFIATETILILRSVYNRKRNKISKYFNLGSFWKNYNLLGPTIFAFGFGLGVIPLFSFILYTGWTVSFRNLVVNARDITINRSLPFPPLIPSVTHYFNNIDTISFQNYFQGIVFSWPFYFPYLICFLTIVDLFLRKKVFMINRPSVFYLRILLILGIILFSIFMRSRADIEHTWPIQFFTFILFPSAIEALFFLLKKYKLLRYVFFLISILFGIVFWSDYYLLLLFRYIPLLVLIIVLFGLVARRRHIFLEETLPFALVALFYILNLLLLDYLRIYRFSRSNLNDFILFDVPRAEKIFVSQKIEDDYVKLVQYILTTTKKGEPIFSGSTRHDKIFINDVLLYFLTETESVTKYWSFEPGIQTTTAVQEEMIHELNIKQPNYVILWALASAYNEPNLSSQSSRVFLLDNYIKEKYKLKKQFGYYLVLVRKED